MGLRLMDGEWSLTNGTVMYTAIAERLIGLPDGSLGKWHLQAATNESTSNWESGQPVEFSLIQRQERLARPSYRTLPFNLRTEVPRLNAHRPEKATNPSPTERA